MGMRPVLNDFSAGEVSPRLAGRMDLGVYQKGAQELTNFQVRALGGVSKRPGTKYVVNTRGDAAARLIPWAIDSDTVVIIEITAGHIRFIDAASGGFLAIGGSPVDLPSSYAAGDLFQIKYAQTFKECYLVHPSYPPFWFRWKSGTITSAVFDYNSADQSFAGNLLSWTAPTTTPYDLFDAWENLASWLVPRKTYTATGTFNSKTVSTVEKQELSLIVTFSDASTLTLTRGTQYSYQGTINIDLRPFMGAGNYPGAVAYFAGRLWMGGSLNDPTTLWGSKPWDYRNFVLCETIEYTTSEKTASNRTDYVGSATSGSPSITGVTPTLVAGALVGKYATGKYIAYGSIISANTTNSITLDRNAIGTGTDAVSASSWKDANVPEYADTVKDTQQIGQGNAIRLILATEEDESILWLAGGSDLYAGTTCSEWVIAGQSNATQAKAQLVSRYGSSNIQARMIGEATMFVTPSSRHIRQLAIGQGALQPPITNQADHIVKDGIVQIDFSQSPDLCLWAILTTGDAVRCLMEPASGVMAWDRVRVRSGDVIESVCVVPGATRDMVYFIVKRTINGIARRFVEYLEENEDDVFTNQWYLDAGKAFSAGGALTGLAHLASQLVTYRLIAGGVETISTGTVDATGNLSVPAADAVQVGLPFSALLKTQRIESVQTEGLSKAVGSVFMRLFRCYSFILRYSKTTTLPAAPVTLIGPYTGAQQITTDIPTLVDSELVIDSSDPVPVGIQTIVPDIVIGG